MTSKKTFTLSDYQRAALTQMGVVQWREQDNQILDNTQAEPVLTEKNVETRPQTLPDAIARFKTSEKSSETQAPAKISEIKALPDAVVVTHSGLENTTLFKDVLLALDLEEAPLEFQVSKPLSTFSQYRFAWQQCDEVLLKDNVLGTPSRMDPQCKKMLWAQIAKNGH